MAARTRSRRTSSRRRYWDCDGTGEIRARGTPHPNPPPQGGRGFKRCWPSSPSPLAGRAIAFGNGVRFLLSPRGEEGTHRISDGKVRGSNGSDGCFRKQRESCASPSPPPPLTRGPSPLPTSARNVLGS